MTIQNINDSFIFFESNKGVDFTKKQVMNYCISNNYKEIEYLLGQCNDDELLKILCSENKEDYESPTFIAFDNKSMAVLKSILDISQKRRILDQVLTLKNNQNLTLLHLLCYDGSQSKILDDWFCNFCPRESLFTALKIEGPYNFFPLFLSISQFQNDALKMFLTLCPEAVFFTNSNKVSLLSYICTKGNFAAIEFIDEALSAFERKDYWDFLANFKTINGDNPLYELVAVYSEIDFYTDKKEITKTEDELKFSYIFKKKTLEESRIEVLKKIELRIGKDSVSNLLLSKCSEMDSILFHGIAAGWYNIADYILQHYPETKNTKLINGSNILHILSTIFISTTDKIKDENDKINFFIKHFLNELNILNQKNNDGYTPLYFARYVSEFHTLANCFEKFGADALSAHKFHYSKFLAHVWSIDSVHGNSNMDEDYPHLSQLNGWMLTTGICEMINYFGYFLEEEMDQNDRSVYRDIFDQVIIASKTYLSKEVKKIKNLIDKNELWLLPIYTPGHVSTLIGQGNFLIYSNRIEITLQHYCGQNQVVPPLLSIFKLNRKLTENQIKQLLNFKGNQADVLAFFQGLSIKKKNWISLKKQPAPICAWINAKTTLLATLFIKILKNTKLDLANSYLLACSHYSKWSNFTKWRVLAIYKKVVEPSNPLIEAVESKAILTHIIKFFNQNPELIEIDPKVKDILNLHLFSKTQKKIDKLIHNFYKTEKRNIIIQALHQTHNPFLNAELKSFTDSHYIGKFNELGQ